MDLKTLLKVDQSRNKNITYQYGRSKTNENENEHRIYRRHMCLKHVHRVELTLQCAILSFSNVSVWTFENASKLWSEWTRIDRCVFDDNTFENTSVWTGSKKTIKTKLTVTEFLHSILRLLNCLPQFLECFFCFLAVLDKRQILFF